MMKGKQILTVLTLLVLLLNPAAGGTRPRRPGPIEASSPPILADAAASVIRFDPGHQGQTGSDSSVEGSAIPRLHSPPGPVTASEPEDPRGLPEELLGKVELTARRTANSATFDMGDGTYALVQDARPLHYRDREGHWRPINPTLVAVENGWLNTTNALHLGLALRSSSAKIGLAEAGVGWEPRGLAAVEADGQATTLATVLPEMQAAAGQLSADGRSVRYPNSWSTPALQDEWRSSFGSAEYLMHLSSLPRLPAEVPPAAVDSLELRVYLHLRPGTALKVGGRPVEVSGLPLETGDPLAFTSAGGDTLWLQPPQAHEERDPSVRVAGSYRLLATADPSVLELRVRVPWDWLAAPERRFPVVIDPIFQMRKGHQLPH